MYHFENIEEMKNCLVLKDGDVCKTLGYYSANDGGGGTYKIVNDNGLVSDEGNVHDLENGLKAKLINDDNYGRYNVKWFGVKGDGVCDDYEKLQYILNIGDGNTYLIPDGTYMISQTLCIESRCNIEMANNAMIKAMEEMTDLIIYNDGKTLGQAESKHITGGILNGNHKVENILTIGNYAGFLLEELNVRNFKSKGIITRSQNSIQATGMKGNNVSIRNYGQTYENTYGLYCNGGDAKYKNITTVDVQTGVYNDQYCIFEVVHVWLSDVAINTGNVWQNSLVAHNKSSYGHFINCTMDTVRTGFYSENCVTRVTNCLVIGNDLFYTNELASNYPCVFSKATNGYIIASNCSAHLNYGTNIINSSADSRNRFINCSFGADSSNNASWDKTNYKDYYESDSQLTIAANVNNPDFNQYKNNNKYYKINSLTTATNQPCNEKGILECVATGAVGSRITLQKYTPFEKPDIIYQRTYQEATKAWSNWFIINGEKNIEMNVTLDESITVHEDSYCKKQGNQVTLHLDFSTTKEISSWKKMIVIQEKPTSNIFAVAHEWSGNTTTNYGFQIYGDGGIVSAAPLPTGKRLVLDAVYFV